MDEELIELFRKLEFNYISIGDDVFSNKTVELIFNSEISYLI